MSDRVQGQNGDAQRTFDEEEHVSAGEFILPTDRSITVLIALVFLFMPLVFFLGEEWIIIKVAGFGCVCYAVGFISPFVLSLGKTRPGLKIVITYPSRKKRPPVK